MKTIKRFTIFAGVNGAGKSTLYNSEDKKRELGVRLNSDELIHEFGGDWRDVSVQLEAGKEILRRQRECLDKGISFNRETTLCSAEIFHTMRTARELGYEVDLRYVGVENVEIAKERIRRRMERGGHGVSDGTIVNRYGRAKENFLKAIPLCDTITVYDNSKESLVCVGYTIDGKLCRTKYPCRWFDEWIKID